MNGERNATEERKASIGIGLMELDVLLVTTNVAEKDVVRLWNVGSM